MRLTFDRAARVREDAVTDEIRRTLAAVTSLDALFTGSDGVRPATFKAVAEGLLAQGDIRALEWAPKVADRDRAAFERAARAQVRLPFRVSERGAGSALVPAQVRSEYFPVLYVEPYRRNEAALGYDLASSPERRAALQAARDTGTTAVTGPIRLVQSPGERGVLAVAPVYPDSSSRHSLSERRASLRGYVLAAITLPNVLGDALSGAGKDGVSVLLLDRSAPPGEQRLAFAPGDASATGNDAPELRRAKTFRVGGRTWQLVASPTPRFLARARTWTPWWALGGGLALTMLAAAYLAAARRRTARIERLVLQRTSRLAESESRFRAIADSAPLLVWTSDADGTVSFINQYWIDVTGRTVAQAEGGGWLDDIHPDDGEHMGLAFARVLERREPYEVEYRVRDTAGEYRWMLERATPRFLPDGTFAGLVGSGIEITELKRAEEEREGLIAREREQMERLRALDALKNDFVAAVSHELRTPLTSILGYAEVLGERDLDDEARALLQVIERNSRRLDAVVGDLLLVARIEHGIELARGPVELGALARESVESATPAAEKRGVRLELDCAEAPRLEGDATRLAQLLDNLVSNAVKFTPAGGRVRIRVARAPGHALVEVADTGLGIPAGEQPRLFERFFRSSTALANAVQGTGLGLTIAKAIVDAHGGSISCESEEGVGTTFRVELPFGPAGEVRQAA